MKKSIGTSLFLGSISIITVSIILLSGIFLFQTHSTLKNRALETTDEQLIQIGSTIEMFIKSAKTNVTFLAENKLVKQIGNAQTSFITPDKTTNGKILETDNIGLEISEIFTNMASTNDGLLEAFAGNESGSFIISFNQELPAGYDPRSRPWYSLAKENSKETVITPVYKSATGDESNPTMAVTTVCRAVTGDNGIAGVVGVDVSLTTITEMLKEMKIGKKGSVVLVQGDGTIIAHPLNSDLNFVKASEDTAQNIAKIIQRKAQDDTKVKINGKTYLGYRTGKTIEGTDWELLGLFETTEINEPLIKTAISVLLLTLIIIAVLYFLITKSLKSTLITPLNEVTKVVREVSIGDFHTPIVHNREDEIGDIQEGLLTMMSSLQNKSALASKIASGDLRDRGIPTSERDGLGHALNSMVGSLNQVIGTMELMVNHVSNGSDQLAQASNALSDGATQQASAIEQISSSMSEIAAKVATNAENAEKAKTLSDTTSGTAQEGFTQMKEMVNAMSEISKASSEIARIMKVIDDIAFQTNLLALNAAVEAARAGQHGKGFAVVADEVRNLAQRSAKASAETAKLIEATIGKIQQGEVIADNTSESFQSILEKINESAELVTSIASSSFEESHSIKEIVSAIDQISEVTQSSTANAEETASTSAELSHHASELQKEIDKFKLENTPNKPTLSLPEDRAPNTKSKPSPLPNYSSNDWDRY